MTGNPGTMVTAALDLGGVVLDNPQDIPSWADLADSGEETKIDIKKILTEGEHGDAELFAALYRGKAIYDHSDHSWYCWRDSAWSIDRVDEVVRLVSTGVAAAYLSEAACQTAAGNDKTADEIIKQARRLRYKQRIQNVLWAAARHPDMLTDGSQWDTNPMLLGTQNGVIDLRSGDIRPGMPTDMIRVIAPTEWSGINTPAPLWEATLAAIFDDDMEVVAFIQRLLGYAITGATTAHILPILWGGGRNGKTTLLQALGHVLGDALTVSTPADTLMDTGVSGDRPQPFLYNLRGKRLAWATESREGARVNTAMIKLLTGGDTLNVRTLHAKPVSFLPTHKVFLITNHCPHIPADDDAAWARVVLIPFGQRFVDNPTAPNERLADADLTAKLYDEASGILAWLVRGCLAWRTGGLRVPAKISTATSEYRVNEDTIADFVCECTYKVAGEDCQASKLYERYKLGAAQSGEAPMRLKAFGQRMTKRFGEPTRRNKGLFYKDVTIMLQD